MVYIGLEGVGKRGGGEGGGGVKAVHFKNCYCQGGKIFMCNFIYLFIFFCGGGGVGGGR